ncbi:MAG: hypothetical protein IPJ88_13445 [Myxococcales bacterium]|nr:MAG: hypothetical protein IPJ88_13445 [Myxococcales bacterium]
MRKAFIEALGSLEDPRANPTLLSVALAEDDAQNFLFNRLATQQLSKTVDDAAVPSLIKALFFFDKNNPRMRMNDVAAEALVAAGDAAYKPLLSVLSGEHKEAKKIVQEYIAAIKARDPGIADELTAMGIMAAEASYALGELGDRKAISALMKEASSSEEGRRIAAVTAMVRLNRNETDNVAVAKALQEAYERADKPTRLQLLAAMQHMVFPGLLPFLLNQAQADENEMPQIRSVALGAYSLLANKLEAQAAKQLIASEPGSKDGGFQKSFEQQNSEALAAASECDDKLQCWISKLEAKEPHVISKAAYMLGRYAKGHTKALKALVAKIKHPNTEVRADILYMVDTVAVNGSPEAVNAIMQLKEAEQGRASWNQIRSLAELTQVRLASRK